MLTIRRLALLVLAFPLVVLPTAGCSSVAGPGRPPAVCTSRGRDHPDGAAAEHADHGAMGAELPLWSVLPFVVLLLCIAIMPLSAAHWWEKNHTRTRRSSPGVLARDRRDLRALRRRRHGAGVMHMLLEYISFIILLGSLYVITRRRSTSAAR